MKKTELILLLLMVRAMSLLGGNWQGAQWICPEENKNQANTWMGFRKEVHINKVPQTAFAKIAVDSKYWLWVNGEIVVREGGLKRGPNPNDTYYDQIDVAPYLKKGKNIISILVWYFGKDGFSHKSSGKGALLFDCQTPEFNIMSNRDWQGRILSAYQTASPPYPNFRLPESSILYDSRQEIEDWQNNTDIDLGECVELGDAGDSPWDNLYLRPIPFWKNYGLRGYTSEIRLTGNIQDTIVCELPYNAQVSPYFRINAVAGKKITICTDNYIDFERGDASIKAEYITKDGAQEFECLGWMNGHKVYYIVPKSINKIEVKYRETGYNAEFTGHFSCSDPFYNKFCKKAVRTLYVNMRDTYMDCPERERAQWTGDAVNEAGQAFYALSMSAHALTKKWLHEVINWQKPNGQLFAPVPAGNWDKELSGQILSTIGYFGLWNYYLHTGDKQTLEDLYDGVKRYLSLWKIEENGLVKFRAGEWQWGDWGDNIDIVLIHNILYYHAIKGMYNSALVLNKISDAEHYNDWMTKFRKSFNETYWNGTAYRHPDYTGATDDRVQALAAVIGLPEQSMYPAILHVLKNEFHASPYMERYVMQALFEIGYPEYAVERYKKRFEEMVNNEEYSTLWELWFKSGPTINHAWSGGGLIMMYQYICGIVPIKAGYKTFEVIPRPVFNKASANVETVAGTIKTEFEKLETVFKLNVQVPAGTTCILGIENNYEEVALNGKIIWKKGECVSNKNILNVDVKDDRYLKFEVPNGKWRVTATK